MEQGYSGSTVQRKGHYVEKISADQAFIESEQRQRDLISLSQRLDILPRIHHLDQSSIFLEYIEGREGLTIANAHQAGQALRLLHNQQSYPHPCLTGLHWLIELANENLTQHNNDMRLSLDLLQKYPLDALIHSEPMQVIEKNDGSIVFIDIEGIGMGSRYQDLGQVYYWAVKENQPEIYKTFSAGYQSDPIQVELVRVKQIAGIVSLAYSGFGLTFVGPEEFEMRIQLGLRLLSETGNFFNEWQ